MVTHVEIRAATTAGRAGRTQSSSAARQGQGMAGTAGPRASRTAALAILPSKLTGSTQCGKAANWCSHCRLGQTLLSYCSPHPELLAHR